MHLAQGRGLEQLASSNTLLSLQGPPWAETPERPSLMAAGGGGRGCGSRVGGVGFRDLVRVDSCQLEHPGFGVTRGRGKEAQMSLQDSCSHRCLSQPKPPP